MQSNLLKLRSRLDKITKQIILGLAERAKFSFDKEEFENEFDEKDGAESLIKKRINLNYLELLERICVKRKEENDSGKGLVIDKKIILLLNERVIKISELIARTKLINGLNMSALWDSVALRKQIISLEREREIVNKSIELAKISNIKNPAAVGEFMQKIINLTTDAQINYIQKNAGGN